MSIKFSPQVKAFIQGWVFVLFEKQYFSFYESANEYVTNIVEAIYANVSRKYLWQSPQQNHFKRLYGEDIKYIRHKAPHS